MKKYFLYFILLCLLASCDWDTTTFVYTYNGNQQGPQVINTEVTSHIYIGTGETIYGPTASKPTNSGTYQVTASGPGGGGGGPWTETKDFTIVPNISLSLPIANLTACYNSASIIPSNFDITASGLTASITITAPSNFEIATTIGGTYSSSLELYGTEGTLSSTLFTRLVNSANVGLQTGTITALSGGATVTSTISGTVNALPIIILTPNDVSGNVNDGIICAGASATLSASGGDTYLWDTNASTASITISPESTSAYLVTATDLNGCSSTASTTITINAYPVLSASAVSICKEGSFLISASTTTPVEYGWNVTGSNAVNKNGYITAGTVGGDYEVSYTDGGFCTSSATVTVIAPSSNSVAAVTGGEASYKFDGATKGPAANIFMGYNGYDFASETNPINPGFYKANKVDGNNAGCPYPFYIFKCTNCAN